MQTFPPDEIQSVLRDFPQFELSYEINVHKKVYNAPVIMAIPEGTPMFAWFTSYKGENVCILFELSTKNKEIIKATLCLTSFKDCLSYGTLFYGTLFKYQQNSCFAIQELLYYKGKSFYKKDYLEKIKTIKQILADEMSQCALNNQYTIFGLPIMANDFTTLLRDISLLPYKISTIHFKHMTGQKTHTTYIMTYFKPKNETQQQQKQNMVKKPLLFHVKPDIQNDIYHLYLLNDALEEELYDIAYIPDYTTSKMMNQFFRTIKENDNLDTLEESDDEEEFENNQIDKFVHLDRTILMKCVYNSKFKKWQPVSTAHKNERIGSIKDLF